MKELRIIFMGTPDFAVASLNALVEANYNVVAVITAADKPAPKQESQHKSAQLAAMTFDPIMSSAMKSFNNEWSELYYLLCVTWASLDDDKEPYCSCLWSDYGMKQTPTKDKKLKPVFHVMATVGSGHICYLTPDIIGIKLGDMLKTAIQHVCPSE